ncbi:prepilin-type N-terminal cleavage/methylation domain-containing protein [Pseudoalteromonas sp. SMS1]|uniref:PilW family protein n=1 Tax=Pseudoalteromonas sp. SMS1 TaxID=2908894 RepID=UPI001F362DF1|nr:prepilin-type N-terminal cleavage/methylation domain-containing protein [Pseudoalteromonas sp. SMS1]MCF2859668.1 prepilin-type N-terminal cleavage/methylation domain-containing protein [Pseudoalteromonas sp. SMS1]
MSLINQRVSGYTLIELLVAMAAGLFLLSGVAMSYTAIKSTVVASKELSHAQEVVRYTSQALTRSIKQTNQFPEVSNKVANRFTTLTVHQDAGLLACDGSIPNAAYSEIYTLASGYITCDIGNGPVQLLRGVQSLTFVRSGILTSIFVTPENLPSQFEDGIQIDIAASRLVLEKAIWRNPTQD